MDHFRRTFLPPPDLITDADRHGVRGHPMTFVLLRRLLVATESQTWELGTFLAKLFLALVRANDPKSWIT